MNDELTEPIESYEEDFSASPPPAWPKWIGGLAIVWGGLMLTCTGLGAVALPFQAKMMAPLIEGAPMPDALKAEPLDWVLLGVGLIFTLCLLFGGIFCVSRNAFGRVLILVWAIPSIPMALYSYVRQMDKQQSLRDWAEQYPDTQYAEMLRTQGATGQQIGEIIGLVLTILLGVIVPAFFILWFGFIKTKPEQFTGSDDDLL